MALHSRYNPQAEASRFVDALSVLYPPDYIVITEPGESYLARYLRQRFPHAVLIAVRYTDSLFVSTDGLWDYVYRAASGSLKRFLLNTIPDEFFANTLFLSWKPADNQWPSVAEFIRSEINEAVHIFKSVMYTRTAFGSLWFKNLITNLALAENPSTCVFSNTDFFFLASGFSAEKLMPFLHSKKAPVLCAGSAYQAALYHSVELSACITTDGSFWAGKHILQLEKHVPLLFPLEAGIPRPLLHKNPCVLLSYGSELESYFFASLHLPYIFAKRNGTVSGTAIELLLEQTQKNIYAFGLDLSCGKSFSHARPHSGLNLVQNTSLKIRSLETVLRGQCFASKNLLTYASWFASLPAKKSGRLFRVGLDSDCADLPNIASIEPDVLCEKKFDDFESALKVRFTDVADTAARKKLLAEFIKTAQSQVKLIALHDVVYSKDKKTKRLKEIFELTAYAKLINFIKTKSNDDAVSAKEKCLTELELLGQRLENI